LQGPNVRPYKTQKGPNAFAPGLNGVSKYPETFPPGAALSGQAPPIQLFFDDSAKGRISQDCSNYSSNSYDFHVSVSIVRPEHQALIKRKKPRTGLTGGASQ